MNSVFPGLISMLIFPFRESTDFFFPDMSCIDSLICFRKNKSTSLWGRKYWLLICPSYGRLLPCSYAFSWLGHNFSSAILTTKNKSSEQKEWTTARISERQAKASKYETERTLWWQELTSYVSYYLPNSYMMKSQALGSLPSADVDLGFLTPFPHLKNGGNYSIYNFLSF